MSESLFLNKTKVDIYSKPITRKLRIGEVSEVDKLKSSYSYTIRLPKTGNNKAFFEMLGSIGNTSRKPYEEVVADYIVDGIYLILNGSAVIRETSKDYQINLINGVRSLSVLLKDKKLIDLPLDDLNHILTTQIYVDSFENTEGFIYGIANYGLGALSTIKVEEQAPSVFVHTLFRRIFEDNNLTLQGEFFTTNDRYLNEVLTPSRGFEITESVYTNTAKGGADSDTLSVYQQSTEFISFQEAFTMSDNSLVGASIVSGNIKFSVAGTYRIDLTILSSLYWTFASINMKLNSSSIAYIGLPDGNSETTLKSITFAVEVDDVLSFTLNGGSAYGKEDPLHPFSIDYQVQFDSLLYLQEGGQLIAPSDYIGDMNQLDFIKDIVNRYGLVLHPIQNSNEFRFKRLEALLNDRATAEDWTSKLSEINSEVYVSGYAKSNSATYNYPDEIVVPNNDGEMLIDNENAVAEKSLFSSPFEIPVLSKYLFGEEVYLIPIWSEETPSEVVNEETPLKVMNIERFDKSFTAKLFDEVTGISVSTGVPYLNLKDMSMTYFIANFYKAFQNLIENFKKVKFILNLSVIDIFYLDFFRLKFFKQTGRFYYMNGVQYTKGKTASVGMIEIKEFPLNLPPSQIGNFSFDMNHSATRTVTLANLMTNYEDPETDEPLKIKIISGFNADVLIKQDGVTITSETEIDVADLALTAVEVLGGVDAYSEAWVFAIADEGSGTYGTLTGTLTANVLTYVNNPPVAEAGSDQSQMFSSGSHPLNFSLNGGGSYDLTGEIVYYTWSIISEPSGATASLSQSTSTPTAAMIVPNTEDNIGVYTLQLTVEDEFGATDTDTMTVTALRFHP